LLTLELVGAGLVAAGGSHRPGVTNVAPATPLPLPLASQMLRCCLATHMLRCSIPLSPTHCAGMALATMFVTLPFIVRELIPTLEQMDLAQEEAAQTLGANPLQVGVPQSTPRSRIILPLLLLLLHHWLPA
jgi:ABC-type sulfate transport system permease component